MEQMKGGRKENKGREISVLEGRDKYAVTGWREAEIRRVGQRAQDF